MNVLGAQPVCPEGVVQTPCRWMRMDNVDLPVLPPIEPMLAKRWSARCPTIRAPGRQTVL